MADSPLTNADLVSVFHMLSDKIDEKHTNTRESIDELGLRISNRMDVHERDDRLLADRILVIETQRKDAVDERERLAKALDKRTSLLTLVISMGVTVCGWIVSKVWR